MLIAVYNYKCDFHNYMKDGFLYAQDTNGLAIRRISVDDIRTSPIYGIEWYDGVLRLTPSSRGSISSHCVKSPRLKVIHSELCDVLIEINKIRFHAQLENNFLCFNSKRYIYTESFFSLSVAYVFRYRSYYCIRLLILRRDTTLSWWTVLIDGVGNIVAQWNPEMTKVYGDESYLAIQIDTISEV